MTQIPEWANWLARNKYGKLWAFEHHPTKMIEFWLAREGAFDIIKETDNRYAHIKWEDEEPTKIYGWIPAAEYDRTLNTKTHDCDSGRYEKHRSLVDELHKIYVAKNKDYGDSFGESVDEFGIIAGVIRIGDKYNRLKTLAKGHEPLVNDESMIDTLKDMANYCLLTIIELEAIE